jgi:hypothetical protein
VAEVLVVEVGGEGRVAVLEAVDRAVLAVEEGAAVADLAQRLADEPAPRSPPRRPVLRGASMVPLS